MHTVPVKEGCKGPFVVAVAEAAIIASTARIGTKQVE
jgi:hypothetical protein